MKQIFPKACLLLLLSGVWIYRTLISPWMVHRCRFVPTCSEYAGDAIQLHGPWQGAILTIKRLSRCHPWGGQGLDEVPGKNLTYRDST